MMKKSKRSDVDPFIVMDVMESARIAEEKGKDIIHMEVGQPGTPAPKIAKDYITNEINKIYANKFMLESLYFFCLISKPKDKNKF